MPYCCEPCYLTANRAVSSFRPVNQAMLSSRPDYHLATWFAVSASYPAIPIYYPNPKPYKTDLPFNRISICLVCVFPVCSSFGLSTLVFYGAPDDPCCLRSCNSYTFFDRQSLGSCSIIGRVIKVEVIVGQW